MAKPTEVFDFGFPEQTTFLKDGLRKKTTPEHWALLECSKPNGLFSQHVPERNNLAANYEAENLHMAFKQASDMGDWKKFLQAHPPSPEALAILMLVAVGEANKARSSESANKGHTKDGASISKRKEMQEIWASGKSKSRAHCAEKHSESIGMSVETGKKALRNTPDPDPWPAKPYKKKT
jgi:hypothetical protein